MTTLRGSWKSCRGPSGTMQRLGAGASASPAPSARRRLERFATQWTTCVRTYLRSHSRARPAQRPTRSAAIGTGTCSTASAVDVSSAKHSRPKSKDSLRMQARGRRPPRPSHRSSDLPAAVARGFGWFMTWRLS